MYIMKNYFFYFFIASLSILTSCSSDSDKSDVNYIKAKINGVDLKFNIISVDIEDYTEYKDIIISATMESDPTKSIIIASQYDVTGEGEIWRCSHYSGSDYYEIQNADTFISNITKNSSGIYEATFSGNLINMNDDSVITLTNGSMKIKY